MNTTTTCDRCGSNDYDLRYSYPTRSGDVRCGACWVEIETLARLGEEVRVILQGAPKINGWYRTDGEALGLIKRAGARMGVLRASHLRCEPCGTVHGDASADAGGGHSGVDMDRACAAGRAMVDGARAAR